MKRMRIFYKITFIAILAAIILYIDTPNDVLLSFDVEPVDGKEAVINVMNVLSENNVNATFFITGEYADAYPEVTGLIDERGFEIGCHSHSHPVMTKISREEKIKELRRCRESLFSITGKEAKGFRAPYHRIDSELLDVLIEEGFEYDASMISNLGILFPSVPAEINEIRLSSFLIIPLSDVINLYYLRMPDELYFFILRNKKDSYLSYNFHPHHVAKGQDRLDEFDGLIKDIKRKNINFLSHAQYLDKVR